MKTLCLISLIIATLPASVFAQAVHHRDSVSAVRTIHGDVLYGTVERETADTIYFRTGTGSQLQFPRAEVAAIDYKVPKPRTHWSEFGGVLGTPAGLNFVVGARWPLIGIRLSGAYWGAGLWGVQAGIPFALYQSEHTMHGVGLLVATSRLASTETFNTPYGQLDVQTIKRWDCGGIAYELNTYGFSLEFGMTFGTGDFHSPQAALQVGYVHENK